jgi:hypothetical protein
MLKFLSAHGHYIDNIDLEGVHKEKFFHYIDSTDLDGVQNDEVSLYQLPTNCQLRSLQLSKMQVQLQSSATSQGVLGASAIAPALKQLRLNTCAILDEVPNEALEAALSHLPSELEHLSVSRLTPSHIRFPVAVLQHLQHLTYLELAGIDLQGPDEDHPSLQALQAMTRLVELRLDFTCGNKPDLSASVLSCARHLMRLEVAGIKFDPGVLADNTQLQHLGLPSCWWSPAGGLAQFLLHLPQLQQLTHLNLAHGLIPGFHDDVPAAAYSALTASSNLQHLDISKCTLPAGVWQHVFPDGRQRPLLQSLNISSMQQALSPSGAYFNYRTDSMLAPEGSRLVSCCPGLQSLNMLNLLQSNGFLSSAFQLAPLQGLSGLHTLHLTAGGPRADGALKVVCQLTGLRELSLDVSRTQAEGLLQLTRLVQLTALTFWGRFNGNPDAKVILTSKVR